MTDRLVVRAPDAYPEILAEMLQFTADALVAEGIDHADAPRVAFAVTERIRTEFGGHSFYMPAGDLYALTQRDDEIYAQFNGTNFDALADQFDTTARHVRRIVNYKREQDRRARQATFPGIELPPFKK